MTFAPNADHPLLATAAPNAQAAVESVVAALQDGLDTQDAETYNRHFSGDVLWGSPFGATVSGYEPLHAIHVRLHKEGRGGRSRYEIERVLSPTPGVALAHVRRVALDGDGQPLSLSEGFHEVALYVLVERGGSWWLAAGQNTQVTAAADQAAT